MKRRTPITQYCHERIPQMIKEPLLCIDATAGTGKDTVFLAKLVGEKGRVISMDIQEMAIEQTKKRLLKERLSDRAEVVLDSHAHMDKYAQKDSVSLIMFNLGYLPGGDHSLSTKADTTIEALEKGLNLLHEGGFPCLFIAGETVALKRRSRYLHGFENCRMINILYLWKLFIINPIIRRCRFIF